MFICFHVFVGWVVWDSGLLWLVIFAVLSRCDLMCKLIRLHTRGCVGSQIRLVACLFIGKHLTQLTVLGWGYAQHILNNRHEYGTMDNLMTLLKPIYNQHLLTTYEQYYIHFFHKHGNLISEQSPRSPNPLFDLTIHPP